MPFELHSDTPAEGADKPFTDDEWPAIRKRLAALAERVGIPIDPPRRNVNSRLALESMELVRALRGDEPAANFHHAVSRAFFVDGANIADVDVITPIAGLFDVAAPDVEAAWREHTYADAVDASIRASRAAGVRGVPAYGWPGDRAVSGMMEPEGIIRALS